MDIFWLFFMLAALQPVITQRLLEATRSFLSPALSNRRSRVVLLVHRPVTNSIEIEPIVSPTVVKSKIEDDVRENQKTTRCRFAPSRCNRLRPEYPEGTASRPPIICAVRRRGGTLDFAIKVAKEMNQPLYILFVREQPTLNLQDSSANGWMTARLVPSLNTQEKRGVAILFCPVMQSATLQPPRSLKSLRRWAPRT